MNEPGKILIVAGLLLLLAGGAVLLLNKTGFPLGKLPGDIIVRKGNTTFYFPIVTSLLISIILSLLLWLFRK